MYIEYLFCFIAFIPESICVWWLLIYWCLSSIFFWEILVVQVMTDPWQTAYSWHSSFLLSVRITFAHGHGSLSLLLTEDTEITRRRLCGKIVKWFVKTKGWERIMKSQQENCNSPLVFVVHFPDLVPEHTLYTSLKDMIIVYLFNVFFGGALYVYISICATIGIREWSCEVHHNNCIDINSTLPQPLMNLEWEATERVMETRSHGINRLQT